MQKSRFTFKKSKVATAVALGVLAMGTLSAANGNTQIVNSTGQSTISTVSANFSQSMKTLSQEIEAIAIATANTVSNTIYQIDKSMQPAMQANVASNQVNQDSKKLTATTTENQVKGVFMQFPSQIVTSSELTSDNDALLKQYLTYQGKVWSKLTVDVPASDTLFLPSSQSGTTDSEPSALYDNYFNFDSLFTPNAYVDDGATMAAKAYVQYVAQNYERLYDGINFSTLKTNIDNQTDKDDKLATLNAFLTNPAWQKYQLSIRSLVAAQSAALSNFNALVVERIPVKDLATNAGMPTSSGLTSGYASPLEVENYVASHRVNDSKWYQQMQDASPATVSRETLFVLAEIENQLQRMHSDNERLLATMSVLALQSQELAKMSLKGQMQDVNNAIAPSNTSTTDTSTTTTSTTE